MERDTLVILPTIGVRAATAGALLASLSPTLDRCVILDDATDEQVAHVAPVTEGLLVSPTRNGLVAAYRAGFQVFAAGAWSYLILLEDGVTITPGWDAAMRRALVAHPRFGWVACGQREHPTAPFTPLCSMMTRAAAVATNGGPDLAFAPCQFDDGDMFMRICAAGFLPHALTHKIHHPVARTSRLGGVDEDIALMVAHRNLFAQRWGVPDMAWDAVPIHDPYSCLACTMVDEVVG